MSSAQHSVLHVLAFQCLLNGQPRKAQTLFSLLIDYTPDDLKIRTGLAYAQIQNGEGREALESLAPLYGVLDPVVQLLFGKAYSALGERGLADWAMKRFCETRPKWRQPVLVDIATKENNT